MLEVIMKTFHEIHSCYLMKTAYVANMYRPTSSLIAFDERVTFWLQRVRSLPCACVYVASFA